MKNAWDFLFSANKRRSPMSHKKRDWSKYNKSLVNRGSLTFWVAPEIAQSLKATADKSRRGRPFTYADTAIETVSVFDTLLI